jgi:metal-responsive CopG/Arc/MetJ family transcriptional regulator
MTHETLRRLTVSLPARLMDELARLRQEHRISVSMIVEELIHDYLQNKPADIIERLQAGGASLRRNRNDAFGKRRPSG